MLLTPETLNGKLAREYLRVSFDRSGTLESPAQQHDENSTAAERLGLVLGDPYAEPAAISASRWSAKARAEFERLVGDLEHGRFGAAVLILWESSRGGRAVKDWVRLIDACETSRALIFVTTHQRVYDPQVGRDRRALLEDAVDAEYDNSKRRTSVLRAVAARAAQGEPHGPAAYGYRRRYHPETRQLLAQERHPAEAPLVAELFARLHAGESFTAIAADWERRGITTRGSRNRPPHPFRHTDLLYLARNPAYAGLRSRQPKGAPRKSARHEGAVPASWPALVDTGVWWAVQARLDSPGRRTARDSRAVHLLSMIARCAECGGPVTAAYRHGTRYYHCRDGRHVQVDADELDAIAKDQVLKYLARDDNAAARQPPDTSPELKAVAGELAEKRAELGRWRLMASRGEVSAASWLVIEPPLAEALGRLEERYRELLAPAALSGWTGTLAELEAKWDAAPVAARRHVARVVQSAAYLGVLEVERAPGGQAGIPAGWRIRWAAGPPGPRPASRVTAAVLRDAALAGLSPEEFAGRLAEGLLFCRKCRAFHPREGFGGESSVRERRCAASVARARRDRKARAAAAEKDDGTAP